ncbi:extracellular lipase, Pla-1/cef family [Enterovibrio norvegicus DSM 15893]|uniref:Extracellular lipase, Pla-1/cef family n=2 Tax=Enterovibrio norvegicus TaxID=188144 RepID=A0A1I5MXC7_9GAMM|nr:extracellular lipase, Pla-1/cef family [Enterovibrio norvegicus DSM 15893]
MNKGLPMNKKLVVLALASALGLTACGGESELSGGSANGSYEDYIQDSLNAPTQVNFQLAGADASIPGPSFLLMNQTDGTLDIPTGGDNALSNPAAAMGTMDGWPVSMPMSLSFKGAGLADGFATTGISIVKLTESLTDPAVTVEKVLQLGTDFNVITSAESAIVVFTQALEPSSEYAFAITNAFTDANGEGVGMTRSYATLISDSNPTLVDSLKPASALTQGVNTIFSAVGIQPQDIVYSSWFTTQSVGSTLYATKAAIASGVGDFNAIWKGSANPNNVDLSQAYLMSVPASGEDYATAIQADTNFATYIDPNGTIAPLLVGTYAANTVTVTKGTVKLPYFLEKGAANWNTTPFESGMPSLAIILSALGDENASTVAQQLAAAGVDTAKLADDVTERLKLVGLTLTGANGAQLDAERIITGFSPIPQVKSLDDVPFVLFSPTTPSGAVELVIYQHGITSAKENAYAFAANIINGAKGLGKDIAVLAIDQPIHGERSLDSTRSANVDPTNYLNLAYLPVGRDNLRQSALDNVGLRAAVTLSQAAGLFTNTPLATLDNTATTHPALFGHSLGGITGFSTVATANNTLSTATTDNSAADDLFTFSRVAAANTGGQIVNLLLGSESFGPLVRSQVTAGVPAAEQESVINQFAYAAQTVIDAVDPFNLVALNDYQGTNVLDGLPIYMQQVKDDDTVPNAVTNAPFAGTIPLATSLGLAVVDSASQATSNGRNFTKFSDVGQHSSVIAPQDANLADLGHTTEMQSQLVQFLSGVAEDYSVADTSVLE